MEGIISYVSGKGWFFAENLADHTSVFVHQKQVENQRILQVGDRISFELGPSPTHPGKIEAVRVKYRGRTIARQVSDGGRS